MSDNTETDALLTLADRIDEADERPIVIHHGAAAELRRLHELNAELVEALREIVWSNDTTWQRDRARAALAKVQGESK